MTTSATVGQKLWNYCNVLRDAGLSYGDYLEQLTYLIFLQGNRVLTEEDFQQVVFPPTGLEPFALDAHFQAGLVLEQIVGNLTQ